MKHETSIALYAHWLSRQREASVRAAFIDAAELAPLLPSLFLLEYERAPDPVFRFCGADLVRRYGRDLTGENFLALWTGADRYMLTRDLNVVETHPNGLVAGVLAENAAGGFTSFEMLLLPLWSGAGVAGMIGSMGRIGGHEDTNRIRARLVSQSLRSVRFLPVTDARLWRDSAAVRQPRKAEPGAAPRRYGHLTVFMGGKEPESSATTP